MFGCFCSCIYTHTDTGPQIFIILNNRSYSDDVQAKIKFETGKNTVDKSWLSTQMLKKNKTKPKILESGDALYPAK